MAGPLRAGVRRFLPSGSSATFASVFLVLLLIGLSRLVAYELTSYYENHWESVSDAQCAGHLAEVGERFTEEQTKLEQLAKDLSSSRATQAILLRNGNDRMALFQTVSDLSRDEDVGIDVYDREGSLLAWEGPGGEVSTQQMRRALGGRRVVFISILPIGSMLTVIEPALAGDSVAGAVLIRRSIETTAPLNNAILRQEALDERLTRELGVTVEFYFGGEGDLVRDPHFCTGSLFGPDSTVLGRVSVQRPVRAVFLESVSTAFQRVDAALWLLLLASLLWATVPLIRRIRNLYIRSLAITIAIWIARYALLWLDIPSGFLSAEVFDPVLYASSFGSGLAKSVGELTITVLALSINVAVVARWTMMGIGLLSERRRAANVVDILGASVLTALLFWLLRGYAAAIRGCVFDSSMTFFDARSLFPSLPLALMTFDLFLLGGCTILASLSLTVLIVRLCGARQDGPTKLLSWLLAALVFALASVLFGILQSNPLCTTAYRLLYGAGLLLSAFFFMKAGPEDRTALLKKQTLLVLAASGIMLYPLLDDFVHGKDRRHVEAFAVEELKPVDGWLKQVVDEGLQGFDCEDYRQRLSEGGLGNVSGIAFERWSSSVACSQGYDAIFTVTDPSGREASRFLIGGSIAAMTEADTSLPHSDEKIIRVRDFGTGVNALKVYAGSMPIRAGDSTLLGYARVVVAAGQHALFRGESPVILRGSSESQIESFYRRVTLSEYRDGVLLTSNNSVVPVAHPLPESVAEDFSDSTRTSMWAIDDIDGEPYESYYIRRAPGSMDVVALSVRELGFTWHLVGVVKLLFDYAMIALALWLLWRIVERRRGVRFRLTFRGRLLLALLVTALLPLTLVAFYARVHESEQEYENLAERLDEETQGVIYNITEHPEPGTDVPAFPATALKAEELASDIGTDFNIYADNRLTVSSRPQLYDVGILDRRLSGNIYSKIVLGGNRFVVQTEKVGSFEYSVGYRPVLDANENIIGVVSVPTLFRTEETEEQAARRNALLAGTYAAVLLSTILVASVFASRIGGPVQKLTEATRRLAKGELDVQVPPARAEGEISELIRSFDQMTRDLRRNRENAIRFERELAWKEMAKQVAHEIKNPLTPMRLSIQHLRRTYLDGAENFGEILESVTRTVIEQIDALSRIASEFSHFARMPRRILERQNLRDIVGEAVSLFNQQSAVTFEMDLAASMPPVLADRDELRRALINVLRNGIQAMDGTGRITIRGLARDEGALVTITDHGKGVPPEMIEKLFMPNFSTKTDGMGLGLAIVKKTIEDLHGRVTLGSTVGRGTTVTIWLPGAEPEESGHG